MKRVWSYLVTGIALSVALALGFYFVRLASLLGLGQAVLVAVAADLVGTLVGGRLAERFFDRPTVSVTVLPYKRGFHLLKPSITTPYVPGPVIVRLSGPPYTHPEADEAKGSQLWDGFLQFPPQVVIKDAKPGDKIQLTFVPLVVKFGVLRVSCLKGDAVGLHASMRYRSPNVDGAWTTGPEGWRALGRLGWYEEGAREKVLGEFRYRVHENWPEGINAYLRNPKIDLNEGESADLQLCYNRIDADPDRGDHRVFLCGEARGAVAGEYRAGAPVRFELEVSIAGQRLPRRLRYYRCAVAWDSFRIEESSKELESRRGRGTGR